MRGGLLTEKIQLFEQQTTTSESGAQKKEWVQSHAIHAAKHRLITNYGGSNERANEEFIMSTLALRVRKYKFIHESMRVQYDGKMYDIILIDKQRDNSIILTLKLTNE